MRDEKVPSMFVVIAGHAAFAEESRTTCFYSTAYIITYVPLRSAGKCGGISPAADRKNSKMPHRHIPFSRQPVQLGAAFGQRRVALAAASAGGHGIALGQVRPDAAAHGKRIRRAARIAVRGFRHVVSLASALIILSCLLLVLTGAGVFRPEFLHAIRLDSWADRWFHAVRSLSDKVFAFPTLYYGVDMLLLALAALALASRWAVLAAIRSYEERIGARKAAPARNFPGA